MNISALESAGVNLTELAEKLRNDTEVDEILGHTKDTARQVGEWRINWMKMVN